MGESTDFRYTFSLRCNYNAANLDTSGKLDFIPERYFFVKGRCDHCAQLSALFVAQRFAENSNGLSLSDYTLQVTLLSKVPFEAGKLFHVEIPCMGDCLILPDTDEPDTDD